MRNNLRQIVSAGAACLMWLAIAPPALSAGAVDSFRIRQIASSQDGVSQIVELEEVGGKNGQDQFAGLTLTVTNRAGVIKTFVFPANLPNADTANRHVFVSQGELQSSSYINPFPPDFILSSEFLPTDGGTIDFAGVDRWTFDAIPTDGSLLLRSGEITAGRVQNFSGNVIICCDAGGVVGYDFTLVGVVEYYAGSLDRYFISGSQPDIDALDSGRIPGWQRTEPNIGLLASSVPAGYKGYGSVTYPAPVCRYYIPPGSHFFSAAADECDAVGRQYPEFVLETRAAFYAVLPDLATGQCPDPISLEPAVDLGFDPVYRLWNNRADTNHRYTMSLAVRAEMIDKGWVSEGYGPMGVAMCGLDYI